MLLSVANAKEQRFYQNIVPGAYFAVAPPVTQYCQVVKITHGASPIYIAWQDGSSEKVDRDFFLPMKFIPSEEFFQGYGRWRLKSGLHPVSPPLNIRDNWYIRWDLLTCREQIALCQQRIKQQQWGIADLRKNLKQPQKLKFQITKKRTTIAEEKQVIDEILDRAIPQEYTMLFFQLRSHLSFWAAIQELERIRQMPASD